MNRYPNESPVWLVVAVGLFVLLALAAPRSAHVIPATDSASAEPKVSVSGNLARSGAPLPAIPLPTQDPGELVSAAFGGTATWYCGGGSPCTRGYGPSDLIAAIDPKLGIPKGTHLRVHHEGRSVDVTVVDVCACKGERIIDLSRLAFSRLADPSLGVIPVAIEEVRGVTVRAYPTPPATDWSP